MVFAVFENQVRITCNFPTFLLCISSYPLPSAKKVPSIGDAILPLATHGRGQWGLQFCILIENILLKTPILKKYQQFATSRQYKNICNLQQRGHDINENARVYLVRLINTVILKFLVILYSKPSICLLIVLEQWRLLYP